MVKSNERVLERLDRGIQIATETDDNAAVEDLKICKDAIKKKDKYMHSIDRAITEYGNMPGIGKTIVNILLDVKKNAME